MSIQFIEHNGQKQFAVIPIALYDELLEKAEMLDDIKTYDQAMTSEGELVPANVVYRIADGENKIKVWREYRGFTQTELAERCGLKQATVAQMEGGKRTGSVAALKAIAEALAVELDDLV
ncbi:helix-turn-helix domain-containing protein [Methylomicrobium lacus]|uniref:helix-turn-helix domain-containing protein n=1 Tax=Methylomicrobium lacus TaxID=136992 RepID=UPI00045EA6DE|nr:helix-turn-helix transcriptional regulator [Methylomicrobium lacus]